MPACGKRHSALTGLLGQALTALGLGEKRCALCHEPFQPSADASPFPSSLCCPGCQAALPAANTPRCRACALPLPEMPDTPAGHDSRALCPSCKASPPPWQGAACHGLYSGKLRDAILALKYSGSLHLCGLFADLLLECSGCLPCPDLIVPVPLSFSRLRERGYNQALEIGRSLSALSGVPLSFKALYRIREARPQEGLDAQERRKNIRGAFRADALVKNRRIWLVDDVMTTGSTLYECSKALLAMGATRVSLLFLARTA